VRIDFIHFNKTIDEDISLFCSNCLHPRVFFGLWKMLNQHNYGMRNVFCVGKTCLKNVQKCDKNVLMILT